MNPKKLCALGTGLALVAPLLAQQPPPYQAPPYQPPVYQAPPPQAPGYQQPAYQQPQAPAYQQPQAPAYQQPPPPSYQQAPPPGYQQAPPPAYQQYPPPTYQQPQAPAYPPPPPPGYQPYQSPSGAAANTHASTQSQGIRYHPWRVQLEGGYTITQGDSVKTLLNDGGSAGLGITWFPTAAIPLGFRVDGSYTSHPQTLHALSLASASTGENIADGHTDIYGGDIDAEIDLHLGLHAREYFFGGIGWYKERTELKSVTYQQGYVCDFFCYPGYNPVYSTAQTSTTDWLKAWNAGIGFEFPLGDPVTFFIDGRFLRIKQPSGEYWDFIPIRAGIRF